MKTKIGLYLTAVLILLFLAECAKKGRPTGGDKDEDAPIMVMAKPAHYTVNFDAKEIKIYFDEFVKLDNVMEQLIISPPLKYQPVIKPLGTASKFISIKLLDTLKANTTYSLNFGESVVDNNEKNILRNFKYVFSTGPIIDSLKIRGTVKDAYDLKTEPYTTVMLYGVDEQYTDSIVYLQKPLYVGNTLDSTAWEITNIKAGKYALVALKDRVKNYLYDPNSDKVAFYKEFINIPQDSVFDLVLFKETVAFKPIRAFEISKGRIQIGYQGDPSKAVIEVLNKPADFKGLLEFEQEKDTVNYWYAGIKDSISFAVQYGTSIDTLKVSLRTKKVDSLSIFNRGTAVLDPMDTLKLVSSIPIVAVDTTKINFIDKDSLAVAFKIRLKQRQIAVIFDKKEAESYQLAAFPGAFTDFFGAVNDSLKVQFKTKVKADYAQLSLSFPNLDAIPLIIHVLNSKAEIKRLVYIDKPEEVLIADLPPDNYSLRIIFDENKNRQWDAGNYLLKRSPEKVVYYENKESPLKANWDVKWTIDLD